MFRSLILTTVLLLIAPWSLLAQSITLTAPSEAAAGSTLALSWSGPSNSRDFISVDAPGAPERAYGPYIYTREAKSGELPMPSEPGNYVIRYHKHDDYSVLASRPLKVTDVSASFEIPATADAGSDIEVSWSGPNFDRDFISVDKAGVSDKSYGRYFYASRETSPHSLTMPDEPGDYEIRYHLGRDYRVVGRAPITVGGVAATLTAPTTALAGTRIEVTWQGPNGARDYISVDTVGASDKDYGAYAYTKEGSPLSLPVPDEPGDYEIRYHLGQTYKVVGSSPLQVTAASASVSGPPQAEGGTIFEVTWIGPDNPRDFITIVPAGTRERVYGNYAYTKRGSPLRLEAPEEPGQYELRYSTGQKYLTLASSPIEIVPGKVPGMLRVVSSADQGNAAEGAVELILDASGSMLQKLGGKRRIELAREAVTELVDEVLPEGTPFALRVFGHREADSCRTDLEIPLAPLNKAAVRSRIAAIEAKNLAKTPIAASLGKVAEDLASAQGPKVVVLVTDGEETCDGDPQATIEALRKGGVDVRVNVVGFAIDEVMLEEQFQSWARVGGGSYFDADDGDALRGAVKNSIRRPFEVVLDAEVVASGVVGGEAIELLPGTYTVRRPGAEGVEQVTVAAREEATVRFED